jgi:tetratricopeptide (TPR) repeat protein
MFIALSSSCYATNNMEVDMKLLLLALVVGGLSFAQTLPADAQAAVERGQAAMAEALETYEVQFPDRPLWTQAIGAGRQAVRLAPGNPEALRFLAEVYSRSNFYGPAWRTWNDFLMVGGDLSSGDAPLFVRVGNEFGYNLYAQGNLEEALAVYAQIAETVPYDNEAFVWAGRILLELERPEEAIPYWQTVVERDVRDQRADYFLALAERQAAFGVDAATAFQEGIALYEAGQVQQAAQQFIRATQENPDYTEAFVWAGRTLLETGRAQESQRYWQAVLDQDPDDERARYFLALARDQATYGETAAVAFREGIAAYEAGNMSEAASRFAAATSAEGSFAEAWAWRGRVAFDQSNYSAAAEYYAEAVRLRPGNETYTYFLNESRRRGGS